MLPALPSLQFALDWVDLPAGRALGPVDRLSHPGGAPQIECASAVPGCGLVFKSKLSNVKPKMSLF